MEQLHLPTFTWPALQKLMQDRAEISLSSQAENTRLSYAADWKNFTAWCASVCRAPLPASTDTVVLYVMDLLNRGRRITTALRHTSGIKDRHRAAGLPIPDAKEIQRFLTAAQRSRCEVPNQKRPISVDELGRMCGQLRGPEPYRLRNHAVLALGFASALRRCNLVALDVADVQFVDEGLTLQVRKEKQDQEAQGRVVGIVRGEHPETCPVRALEAWLRVRGTSPGPLFTHLVRGRRVLIRRLGPDRVGKIVKAAVAGIGLERAQYAGHSLRSGCITTAFESGADAVVVARHTGHRSLSSLRRYIRCSSPFRANCSGMLGL